MVIILAEGECIRVFEYNDEYTGKRVLDRGPVTYRLFIYDLPSSTTTEGIETLFAQYGKFS